MPIEGLIDYLRIAFSYIQALPVTIKEAIHFITMTKINRDLLDYLYSKKVIKINILSVLQLELDCQALITFANLCGVSQLSQCFIELSQVIKVLLLSDFNILLDNKVAVERFPYVDVYKVSFLIEKVILLLDHKIISKYQVFYFCFLIIISPMFLCIFPETFICYIFK